MNYRCDICQALTIVHLDYLCLSTIGRPVPHAGSAVRHLIHDTQFLLPVGTLYLDDPSSADQYVTRTEGSVTDANDVHDTPSVLLR